MCSTGEFCWEGIGTIQSERERESRSVGLGVPKEEKAAAVKASNK